MGRVALLSEELINQIAAGEVVERPASVIKELGENALDAGARNVRIRVRGGGLEEISVTDDGFGMSREDAEHAILRHATSKLRDLEGLSAIETLGFRGEALAAIAAVSRFTLTTSEPNAPSGTRLCVDGGGAPVIEDAAPFGGTEIRVEDLFFNTPARRKFLRRAETEVKHVEEAVLRIALPHPRAGFSLESDGKILLAIPENASARERLIAAVGKEVDPHLLEADERRLGLRVHGVVAAPEFTLSHARGLYTFVNGRYVRDRGLIHAVQRAFGASLPPGRQPVTALFIELDPHAVDVNVHPQKLEVRFLDGRTVYEAVQAAVSNAVGKVPWGAPVAPTESPEHYALAVDRFLQRAMGGPQGGFTPFPALAEGDGRPGFGQLRPTLNDAPPPGFFESLKVIGPLAHRFWVCEGQGGSLIVLDRHAALERLRRDELENPSKEASGSLFRATAELPAADAARVTAQREAFAELGLSLEPFGHNSFVVSDAPACLEGTDLASVLVELSSVLPATGLPDASEVARGREVMACHAATAQEAELSHDALARTFRALDKADFRLGCIHGSIVAVDLPLLELERRVRAKN
jgi:DNA mismatch repair protein MutL